MENTTMVSYRPSVSYQKVNQQNRANYSRTLFHPVRPSIIIRSISNEKYCSQPHEQYEGASHSKINENIYDGVQVFSLAWLQVLEILCFSASFANFSDQLFWKLWGKKTFLKLVILWTGLQTDYIWTPASFLLHPFFWRTVESVWTRLPCHHPVESFHYGHEKYKIFFQICVKLCNTRKAKVAKKTNVEDLGARTTWTSLCFRSSSENAFQLA